MNIDDIKLVGVMGGGVMGGGIAQTFAAHGFRDDHPRPQR